VINPDIHHVVMFSGGVCSWAAGKRVVAKHGVKNVRLLFADVKGKSKNEHDGEDGDTYRFLEQAAKNIGAPLTIIQHGNSVWGHFFASRMMGNSKTPICSVELKREILDGWQEANCDPQHTTLYFGIDWTEAHRLDALRGMKVGWRVEAPMCDAPYMSKPQMLNWLKSEGITPPRLYTMGYPHNNCGGFCVKAGQAHFAHLLRTLPERYAYHENKEQEFRAMIGKDVSILRDRSGGTTKPLTLKDLRERIQQQQEFDCFDWGGCGCAVE
jgi:hypothetical protein